MDILLTQVLKFGQYGHNNNLWADISRILKLPIWD